jgi:hypothetical protein
MLVEGFAGSLVTDFLILHPASSIQYPESSICLGLILKFLYNKKACLFLSYELKYTKKKE